MTLWKIHTRMRCKHLFYCLLVINLCQLFWLECHLSAYHREHHVFNRSSVAHQSHLADSQESGVGKRRGEWGMRGWEIESWGERLLSRFHHCQPKKPLWLRRFAWMDSHWSTKCVELWSPSCLCCQLPTTLLAESCKQMSHRGHCGPPHPPRLKPVPPRCTCILCCSLN